MGTKVTLRALDHLLMASLRHKEGSALVTSKKPEEAAVKFKEAAKHMQLASEQDDFDDTIETLNAANEEGWEEEDEDEEVEEADADELDDDDLDADLEDEEATDEIDEEDLEMTVDDEEVEEDDGEVMAKALASATKRAQRRAAVAAQSASDEDEFEGDVDGDGDIDAEDFKKADEEASLIARRKIRAQANLRILSGKTETAAKGKAAKPAAKPSKDKSKGKPKGKK